MAVFGGRTLRRVIRGFAVRFIQLLPLGLRGVDIQCHCAQHCFTVIAEGEQ
jgi:hypothetical protein